MYTTYYSNSTMDLVDPNYLNYLTVQSAAPALFHGETKDVYKLIVDMAGCSKEDVRVTYVSEDRKVNIKASVKVDDFNRDYSSTYIIPAKFELDEMKCSIKNGLLTIEVPYKKTTKPKEVKIQ
jgi:HSP20 family molecular chaperone IbpA